MVTQHLFSRLLEDNSLQSIPQHFDAGALELTLTGITPAAKPAYLAILQKILNKPVLFISASKVDLEEIARTTAFYQQKLLGKDNDRVAIFPAMEPGPYSGVSPHPEVLGQRAVALWRTYCRTVDILVCAPTTLVTRLPDLRSDFRQVPELVVGLAISPDKLVAYLEEAGYIAEEPVVSVGAFSRRGGILDVFPPVRENPVRVEFFGDEIESLREFSVTSQRSVGTIERLIPIPMRETFIDSESLQNWSQKAAEKWHPHVFPEFFENQVIQARQGESFQGVEFLLPLTIPLRETFLNFASDFAIVLDEPADLEEWLNRWKAEISKDREELSLQDFPSFSEEEMFLSLQEAKRKLKDHQVIRWEQLGVSSQKGMEQSPPRPMSKPAVGNSSKLEVAKLDSKGGPDGSPVTINCQTTPVTKYKGDFRRLVHDVYQSMESGGTSLFAQSSLGRAERLLEILREYDLPVTSDFDPTTTTGDLSQSRVTVVVGQIFEGFYHPSSHTYIFGERDVYDEVGPVNRSSREKSLSGSFLSDFRELSRGDLVVHLDHGIGRYQGLKKIIREGIVHEFMVLEYGDEARLYVPLERLDLVQKHSRGDVPNPKLDKLGGQSWKKIKSRIKKSMRDMTQDLLKLSAERKIAPGYGFSAGGTWHREFDEVFEFDETPDQLKAIHDINCDMELNTPMDRLLCGDVGFGKTEVAMRAAFKAAFDGKQVAVLAPTTVLVYQHYLRFKQRFTAVPITVEMLSRFRNQKQQKVILDQAAIGKIDVLIGTHRMLSKDMRFRDLGLLIVDEEQRFGVADKEKLKRLKRNVDTLTMTATPIPRTLHMSLMGIRDMSIIESPPRNRFAIQTSVLPFSQQIIHSAIRQELKRHGQVYFVHNKIDSIYSMATLIQKSCPEARLLVVHGQMPERELESKILAFLRHEADVLLTTTIIENGLDIPLVNTIIVNRSDQFGLAQLYQLRGRVGRSNRRAYAYLLVPSGSTLSGIARQRLAALKEFSDLGSGFKVAALDLELRGAGNLLGGEQHGHINAVGFDLYCQMLERTIQEVEGQVALPEIQAHINLRMSAKIPLEYILDENQRLSTYKRVSSIKLESEMDSLRRELEDRYGPVPEEVETLMDYMRVRRLAERVLVQSIEREKDGIVIKFHQETPIRGQRLVEVVSNYPGLSVDPSGQLRLQSAGINQRDVLSFVRTLLRELSL